MDNQHCPLCNNLNLCALSEGKSLNQCWCINSDISQDSIAAIPAAQRGVSCICSSCASKLHQISTKAQQGQ